RVDFRSLGHLRPQPAVLGETDARIEAAESGGQLTLHQYRRGAVDDVALLEVAKMPAGLAPGEGDLPAVVEQAHAEAVDQSDMPTVRAEALVEFQLSF